MTGGLADLLAVARLLQERDLARLAGVSEALRRAEAAEADLAHALAERRASFAADLDGLFTMPGAFEASMRHGRREQAKLAATRAALARARQAAVEDATRSVGRASVLENLAARMARH